MSLFKEREETFERKYVHDEDLKFKALSRRNKALGLWAADRLGKIGNAAEAYALEVVRAEFGQDGEEAVFRKIREDFDAAGVQTTDDQIRRVMLELLSQAIDYVKTQ